MIGISDLDTKSRLNPRAIVYLGHAQFSRGELTRYKKRISWRLLPDQKRTLNSVGSWDVPERC
jgi:hypothetical protein